MDMTDKSLDNLEKVIRKASEEFTLKPGSRVLWRIRFRLGVSDFFSVKPRKFNIVYALLVVSGLIAGYMLLPGSNENIAAGRTGTADESITPEEEGNSQEVRIERRSDERISETGPERNIIPSARFESDFTAGCAPLKVQFFNKSVASDQVSWDFGNGDKSELSNPVYTFTEPGEYKVTLSASSANNIYDTYYQTIKVLSPPKADFSINIEQSVIGRREVSFVNHSEGGEKYIWDFGDADKDTGFELSHTYSDFGTYNVSLIAIADNGCMDTITHENRFIEKNYELYFPVSFKPNPTNKGSNGFYERAGQESSVFYPSNHGAQEYELRIYAPNGIEIFKTTNIKQGWNGYIRGIIAPGGIYSYRAAGLYPNGKPFSVQGKVKVTVDDYYQN